MKYTLSIAATLMVFSAQAGELRSDFIDGQEYYTRAKFSQAAKRFRPLCNANDAEACYWAGLSYERLADIRTPFGCRADAKAHEYFVKAARLAPGQPVFRDALFDFLLDTTDCLHTALREAARILEATPRSGPEYELMQTRLGIAARQKASLEEKLANLFLLLPRATYAAAVR